MHDLKINMGLWQSSFALPDIIRTQYIYESSGLQLKVLMLLTEADIDIRKAADRLDVAPVDIEQAIAFWESKGIFTVGSQEVAKENTISAAVNESKMQLSFAIPIMGSGEAAKRMQESGELKFLLDTIQNCFGRLLTANEQSQIISICDYTGLTADIMLMLVEYAQSIGKGNLAYIKRVALDWNESGIDSHEKAEEQIQMLQHRSKAESVVRNAFGISGRSLAQKEKELAVRWVQAMGFDEKMLKLAYDRCALATGKLSFSYIDKILEGWNARGITTPKQADKETLERKNGKQVVGTAEEDDFVRLSRTRTPKI